MANDDIFYSSFASAATQASMLVDAANKMAPKGGSERNKAARLLLEQCGPRLIRYLKFQGRITESVAEELVSEVVMSVLYKPCPDPAGAAAWLMRAARNELIDWARKNNAQIRGNGQAEITLDEDDFMVLLDTAHGHLDLPAWVRSCLDKAAALMQKEHPERFAVLEMIYDGLSAEEIFVYFEASSPAATHAKVLTSDEEEKQKKRRQTAARDRIYRTRLVAKEYFAHCKE